MMTLQIAKLNDTFLSSLSDKSCIFYGPFVGEFGWELLFWQGLVQAIAKSYGPSFTHVAISRPGRHVFYQYLDVFLEIPDNVLPQTLSPRGYIADEWYNVNSGTFSYFSHLLRSLQHRPPSVSSLVSSQTLFGHLYRYLSDWIRIASPKHLFCPWLAFSHKEKFYGFDSIKYSSARRHLLTSRVDTIHLNTFNHPPSFLDQTLSTLHSTAGAEHYLRHHSLDSLNFISIFPRRRLSRRPDKNSSKDFYDKLILALSLVYPEFKIAILGEPGGCHYADGALPDNCVDFINVPSFLRADIHSAVLHLSSLALGSMSGAMLFALANGCRSVIWGQASQQVRYYSENYTLTPMAYISTMSPSLEDILDVSRNLLPYNLHLSPSTHLRFVS